MGYLYRGLNNKLDEHEAESLLERPVNDASEAPHAPQLAEHERAELKGE